MLIPGGFAHGFMVIEDSMVSYKCDECFDAQNDDGIIWNDKDLEISWPIVSEKDLSLQTFKEFISKYGALKP